MSEEQRGDCIFDPRPGDEVSDYKTSRLVLRRTKTSVTFITNNGRDTPERTITIESWIKWCNK